MAGTSEGSCCLCLDSLVKPGFGRQTLSCGHVFHEQCIVEMRRWGGSGRCPLCRQTSDDLTSAQSLMDQATENYARRSYGYSVRLASEVLDIDPCNAGANMMLGVIFSQGQGVPKDIDRARNHLEEAHRCRHPEATSLLGTIYEQQNLRDKARELYQEGMRRQNPRSWTLLGALYQKQGQLAKAQELYEEGHVRGDELAGEHLQCLYVLTGQTTKAQEFLEDMRPRGDAKASTILGALYLQQGDWRKAQELLEEGSLRGDANASTQLGELYQRLGQLPRALEFFEEGRHRGDARASTQLGAFYHQMGQFAMAQDLYEEGRRGGDAPASSLLGAIFQQCGQLTKAKEFFEEGHSKGDTGLGKALLTKMYKLIAESYQKRGDAMVTSKVQAPNASSKLQEVVEEDCTPHVLSLGARVQVHSLVSAVGVQLNGSFGTIVKYDTLAERVGVQIDGIGLKSIRKANLTPALPTRTCMQPPPAPEFLHPDVIAAQAAIESSLHDAPGEPDVNAQLSRALLQSRPPVLGPHVILLTFSRSPQSFRETLLQASELEACRQALEVAGFAVELPSGAKVFVEPQHYLPTVEAVRLGGWTLMHQHVLVDPELADAVIGLVLALPGREKIRPRGAKVLPVGFATAVTEMNAEVYVSKDFINIRVPSSLCSDVGTGLRTASTTDADERKGKNHR